jgi:hypothetical protein
MAHAPNGVVLHDLILHQGQFQGHVHRLPLMVQHAFAHLVNYQFATLHVFLRPNHFGFQPFYLALLDVLKRFHFVFLLNQCIPGLTYLAELISGLLNLFGTGSKFFNSLLLGALGLQLHDLFILACLLLVSLQLVLGGI